MASVAYFVDKAERQMKNRGFDVTLLLHSILHKNNPIFLQLEREG